MDNPFFTVGHSTHPIPEFVDLLRAGDVHVVVDVRTVPRSRKNPQYNTDVLPDELGQYQVGYEHIAALGGLKSKSKDVPTEVNAFWDNGSFHNYADYALTPVFHAGFERLLKLGSEHRCAIMCAEAVWWRCHRRIITDYLLAAGKRVFHLMGTDKVEPAKMNEAAQPQPDGSIFYP